MKTTIASKFIIAIGICLSAFLTLSSSAEAVFRSGSDLSGVAAFDFLEVLHRQQREDKLTDEQKELKKDAAEMHQNLRAPLDASKPVPVSLEGDDLLYDQETGDVYAKGDVVITSLDAQRFKSDEVTGNLKKQEVKVEGLGHVLSMKPGEPRAYLDGYHIVYNYGTGRGSLDEAQGKLGHYYVKGKKIEIYKEKIIVYDGYQTKCGAKTPDYRVSGDLIEIYPEKEMIIHQAKFWLKDKIFYSRDILRVDISPGADNNPHYPRVGYDSDDGVWIKETLSYDVAKNIDIYAKLGYYSKHGMRNVYGVEWNNAGNYASVEYGQYEDNDNKWIKKEPNFIYEYTNRVGEWPLSYTLKYEHGNWKQKGNESIHTGYEAHLYRDPIRFLDTWYLLGSVGYKIYKEGLDHSRTKGYDWNASLYHTMGPYLIGYLGYSYSKVNVESTMFDYNLQDYARQINGGLSLSFTERDRLVVGFEQNAQTHKTKDIDWLWFHDMHCAQMIVEYRAKRDQWNVKLQFTPW
ncbi:MAG: LPS-assembly protein LptD [Schwartzia sp.]|nr:LPS-assembly protein LptD [Schwartzia sp. (in: firmicutes)]